MHSPEITPRQIWTLLGVDQAACDAHDIVTSLSNKLAKLSRYSPVSEYHTITAHSLCQ